MKYKKSKASSREKPKHKPVTAKLIRANIGFLGSDGGSMLKALADAKKEEKKLEERKEKLLKH